jgi:hypothetical protein
VKHPFVERLSRVVLAGAIAGAATGLLWGGLGGRIAMRVIFLTSHARVAGLQSDDGFTIGTISTETMFLIATTTLIGAVVGPAAAILRTALRTTTGTAATAFAVAAGTFFGGAIVHTDGIDFRVLDPLALTTGLFIFIPGAAAATGVLVLDRLLRPGGRISRLSSRVVMAISVFAVVPVVVLTGAALRDPVALTVLTLAALGGLVVTRLTHTADGNRMASVAHWAVWGVLGALTGLGLFELWDDIAALA